MTLPRSLADILDVWPSPADPPEADEDWSLLDELAAAVSALTEKLRAEPALSRDDAMLFCKQTAPEQSIHFRSLIWPQARKLAGLPPAKGGRRQKSAAETGRTQS